MMLVRASAVGMGVRAAWRRGGLARGGPGRAAWRQAAPLGWRVGRPLSGKAAASDRQKRLTREHALEVREAFNRWRRDHTVFLVSSGILLGAGIFGAALWLYLDKNPSAIEFFVVEKTVRAFNDSLSFDSKKAIYLGLPEPTLPNFETAFLKALAEFEEAEKQKQSGAGAEGSAATPVSAEAILNGWADLVEMALSKAEKTWILAAKTLMRNELYEDIKQNPDFEKRLDALLEIFPPSVERNLAVSAQVDSVMQKGELVPGAWMERLRPQTPEQSCDAVTNILIHAIAFFPGPINLLIHFLDSPAPATEDGYWDVVKDIVDNLGESVAKQDRGSKPTVQRHSSRRLLEKTGLVHTSLEKTLARMKRKFDSLPQPVKSYVLTTALRTTVDKLPTLPRIGGIRPYDLYVRAIENDLIGPLRRDARITEDILREVKHIFLAMPSDLQTRVLLTAIRHPLANTPLEDASPEAQAELVRDLLSSGGVVAVKLAQMLAEHPRMPADYQVMLGSLRDENEPMPATTFWWQIPSAVRSSIRSLGRCLGTGSVKQANLARFEDGHDVAVVVLRAQVEDEALSSISALETSDELGPVATRLGRLVYGEFNLFQEGEVLQEFARTQIGLHPLLQVVRVRHHSPKCLVEEIAKGVSVADALEKPVTGADAEAERKRVFEILIEYHKTVMTAFIADGVIHSDVHLGNANYVPPPPPAGAGDATDATGEPASPPSEQKDPQEGASGVGDPAKLGTFALFDVGQFQRIGLPDTKALLWLLAAMSTPEHRVTIKHVAIGNLAQTASLKDKAGLDDRAQRRELKTRLEKAFADAIKPNDEGVAPDKRTAYMLFLRAAERHGVDMPGGAFAVAKMIDGIVSQQERYDLPTVVDECIETFLRSQMTWGELVDIGSRQLKIR